jgi:PBSX family phage terminase large subunit
MRRLAIKKSRRATTKTMGEFVRDRRRRLADRDFGTVARFLKPFGVKAHEFAFRPPAQDRKYNILEGAVRSSKTWAMMPKFMALFEYHPGGLKIITGQSKQAIWNNVLNDLFTVIGRQNFTYNRMSGDLVMFGDHWLVIGARDEASEKIIRGSTIGVCVGDELTLMPESFFMMLTTRLSLDGSRFYGTTNPGNPFHYLKVKVIDNRDYKDILFSQRFTLDDNPNLADNFKRELRRTHKGVFYKRFILGEWVMAEGAIYGSAYNDENLFDEESRPPGLYGAGGYQARYVGVDYGTTNPCTFSEILDDGVTLWKIGEYYWDSSEKLQQKTDEQYATDMADFLESSPTRRGISDVIVIVDPSAASFKLALRAKGLYVIDADNEVEPGIRKMAMMLTAKKFMIHRDRCPMTMLELPNYSWDPKAALRGIEQPIKFRDHTCDADRYVVQTQVNDWRAVL